MVLVRPGREHSGRRRRGRGHERRQRVHDHRRIPAGREEPWRTVIAGTVNGAGRCASRSPARESRRRSPGSCAWSSRRRRPGPGRRRWPTAPRSGSPSWLSARGAAPSSAGWRPARSAAFAVERLVTVLVIACPHALGLAVPARHRHLDHSRRPQRAAGARPPRSRGGPNPHGGGLRQDRDAHAGRVPRRRRSHRRRPHRGRGAPRSPPPSSTIPSTRSRRAIVTQRRGARLDDTAARRFRGHSRLRGAGDRRRPEAARRWTGLLRRVVAHAPAPSSTSRPRSGARPGRRHLR